MRTILLVLAALVAAAAGFFAGRMTSTSHEAKEVPAGAVLSEGSTFSTPAGLLKVLVIDGDYRLARDGVWTTMLPDGETESRVEYSEGVLDGPAEYRHPNGQPREQGAWRKGKKHGPWTAWNPQGTKVSEAEFVDGVPSGTSRAWDAAGNLIAEQDLLEKAKVGGKYRDLIMRFKLAEDRKDYGDFKDFGYYRTTHHKGIRNIPTGYWVYVYPYWHIWREKVE